LRLLIITKVLHQRRARLERRYPEGYDQPLRRLFVCFLSSLLVFSSSTAPSACRNLVLRTNRVFLRQAAWVKKVHPT